MKKRVLVTGGNGFLGYHLCQALHDRGDSVISLDNFSSSAERKAPWPVLKRDISEGMPDLTFNEIYNLACPASPPRYQASPLKTLDTCYTGLRNVLDYAVAAKAKVLQASTSEVYGDPDVTEQDESYLGLVRTMGPRACYDEGKRVAETLMYEYAKLGVVCRVARIFNTYGPGMDVNDGRVVSNFICQAIRGEPLTIYGDGRQTRSFCYVSDMVRGLIALMDMPAQSGEPFPVNLGNPEEVSISELACRVTILAGVQFCAANSALPQDDPKVRKPAISLAGTLLDWRPTVSLTDGLTKTIEYFRAVDRSDNVQAGQ